MLKLRWSEISNTSRLKKKKISGKVEKPWPNPMFSSLELLHLNLN